jgi:phage terminase small subunit
MHSSPIVLDNDQARFFAGHYANTFDPIQSLISIGYSKTDAENNFQSVMLSDNVKEALHRQFYKEVALAQYVPFAIIRILQSIALYDISDCCEVDGGQVFLKDSADWSARSKAAIKRISADKYGNVTCIETYDKLDAVKQLAKIYKLFDIDHVSDPDSPTKSSINISVKASSYPELESLIAEYVNS